MGDALRAEDSTAASLAERASRGMEGVARYVSSTDARGFARDAEQLARRQPALFFGSAFLLGLAAGRFLKSSSGGDVSQPRLNRLRGQSRLEPEPNQDERAHTANERKSEPVPRRPGNPRFQANYDATFGQGDDIPRDASSTTGAGPSLPHTPSAPENVGSAERAKGIAP